MQAALARAEVTLISGPTILPPNGAVLIKIETALEMYNAVMDNFKDKHIIKTAAVADYRQQCSVIKIKRWKI